MNICAICLGYRPSFALDPCSRVARCNLWGIRVGVRVTEIVHVLPGYWRRDSIVIFVVHTSTVDSWGNTDNMIPEVYKGISMIRQLVL